ncbi:MAG: metallophosphoesterase [Bacteroidetes bacterium]|nr:metallophosphoesterase [Bacteroidota bacterium]
MKSPLLNTLVFVFGFIIITDLFAYRAIRFLMRGKRKFWRRFVGAVHFGITLAVLAGFLYFFTSVTAERYGTFRTFFSGFVMAFYVSKIIFTVFVLFEDVLRFFEWMTERYRKRNVQKIEEKGGMSRADFIYSAGAITAAVPFYLMLRGVYKSAYDYQVHRVKLEIPNLPKAWRGKRIVQLSDIHSGSLADIDAVAKGVQMVKDTKPDIFMFTGDLVNNFAWEANDMVDIFRGIKADIGTYSILGNHDYGLYHHWESKEAMEQNFRDLVNTHKEIGWNLMRNEHEVLEIGGRKLGLLGVENWGHSARFPKRGDVNLAERGMQKVDFKLLMSHDPSHWDAVVRKEHRDIAAMFSGHTHGAQLGIENKFFKWSPVQYIYKQWAGMYEQNGQQLYVNRGFGFIGYPGRVGILPEITVFELA